MSCWDVWRWKCCECGSRTGLFCWATNLYVCRECAIRHNYDAFCASVAAWLWPDT